MAAAAAMGLLSIASAQNQAAAYDRQAAYTEAMNDINSRRAEIQFKDTLERGNKDYLQHMKQTNKLVGSQKTAIAAQGIRMGDTAGDVIQETETLGYEDAQKIKTNAFREALGYKIQQFDNYADSKMAVINAGEKKASTLLAGGMQAAGYFSKSAQSSDWNALKFSGGSEGTSSRTVAMNTRGGSNYSNQA